MARGEISWKELAEDGSKREVYAKRVGNEWRFFARGQRFDQWQAIAQPSLDAWIELLDGVRRRIARRLVRPEEEGRVIKTIKERFPDADI